MALWTVAHKAPLSTVFPRQEYCSVLPLSSPGDLPDPGIEPVSPALKADSLLSKPPGPLESLSGLFVFVLLKRLENYLILSK